MISHKIETFKNDCHTSALQCATSAFSELF